MSDLVHIAMSVHNGVPYVAEQIRSIQAQSHERWILWVRDDGSTDTTRASLDQLAREDARIRVHPSDGTRLGTTLCHDWLLSRLPGDAEYIFSCDADDVWLPNKIRYSLELLRSEEAQFGGPILVHTDLTVVDASLRPLARSLWALNGSDPHATDLKRLAVSNVATGPTLAFNRALLDEILPIPSGAAYHDWWIALVASAFGRIVALAEPTVLYRRHADNVTTVRPAELGSLAQSLRRLVKAPARAGEVRGWVEATARQAEAFLSRFPDRLATEERERLQELADLPKAGVLRRKLGVMRHHALPERGFLRNVGIVLRA